MSDKRDIKADREMCEKATPGPWRGVEKGNSVRSFSVETVAYIGEPARHICSGISPKTDDCQFIVESREALPHYIKRTMEAESLLSIALDQLLADCETCEATGVCSTCEHRTLKEEIDKFLNGGQEPIKIIPQEQRTSAAPGFKIENIEDGCPNCDSRELYDRISNFMGGPRRMVNCDVCHEDLYMGPVLTDEERQALRESGVDDETEC